MYKPSDDTAKMSQQPEMGQTNGKNGDNQSQPLDTSSVEKVDRQDDSTWGADSRYFAGLGS